MYKVWSSCQDLVKSKLLPTTNPTFVLLNDDNVILSNRLWNLFGVTDNVTYELAVNGVCGLWTIYEIAII